MALIIFSMFSLLLLFSYMYLFNILENNDIRCYCGIHSPTKNIRYTGYNFKANCGRCGMPLEQNKLGNWNIIKIKS